MPALILDRRVHAGRPAASQAAAARAGRAAAPVRRRLAGAGGASNLAAAKYILVVHLCPLPWQCWPSSPKSRGCRGPAAGGRPRSWPRLWPYRGAPWFSCTGSTKEPSAPNSNRDARSSSRCSRACKTNSQRVNSVVISLRSTELTAEATSDWRISSKYLAIRVESL